MKKFCVIILCLITGLTSKAAIRLPKIFSNNMVLQREAALKIWGWAEKNSTVSVDFNGQSLKAKSNSKGIWIVTLKPMQHGGPFEMKVADRSGSIQLTNILIGDVWLGSGQSNMEWIVKNSNNPKEEIAAGNYDNIRLFTVDHTMSFSPQQDVSGGPWQVCSSATVGDFSAVAYFFGRKLSQELDIPIGLINSSWGGTNIQTWISWDVMSLDDDYKNIDPAKYEEQVKETQGRVEKYQQALKNDKGLSEKWYASSFQSSGWKKMLLPLEWGETELGDADGIVWFRKEIELPAGVETHKALLGLGPIDDWDDTYVNGTLIGSTHEYTKDRQYPLAAGVLKPGKNLIVVKVTDTGGGGGLDGRTDQLFLETDGNRFPLHGEWEYQSSVLTTDFDIKETGPNTFPSQLYNSMIAPLTTFAIKGFIWYQGEANVGRAYQYRTLFPTLIKNWRAKWGQELPFYWVQLANFLVPSAEPGESAWAELREAQSMTLQLPSTGEAVAIDIGEANDIHPRNKQDVGLRLALAGLHVTYDKNLVHSGPRYKSMTKEVNSIKLNFDNVGRGLQAKGDKYGYLKGFAIAGVDKRFFWAKARIEGDHVVVYSEKVSEPVSVRYGWANNPDDANLFNLEGLPASPFRTDTWPGVTK